MRTFAALLPVARRAWPPRPRTAQRYETVTVEEWTESAGDAGGADRFVAAGHRGGGAGSQHMARSACSTAAAPRWSMPPMPLRPRAFAAMLPRYPGIATLEMIECPGTDDDTANLALGRMIRARGIATHVPADGSVRSGAVELFLAGKAPPRSTKAPSSRCTRGDDPDGREAGDFAADAAPNRAYLDYYREMGVRGEAAGVLCHDQRGAATPTRAG